MTQEQIIEQIEQSFSEYKGSNEAVLDASHYISKEFEKAINLLKLAKEAIADLTGLADGYENDYVQICEYLNKYDANT
jgi:phosphoserine aminotransferase